MDKLCGSCSENYGLVGSSCEKCREKGTVVFSTFLSLVWFCVLAGISMKGNLDIHRPSNNVVQRNRTMDPSMQTSVTRVEMSQRIISTDAGTSSSSSSREEKFVRYDITKRGVAERLKVCPMSKTKFSNRFQVFVNFAQVSGMALLINIQWTRVAIGVLRALGKNTSSFLLEIVCRFHRDGFCRHCSVVGLPLFRYIYTTLRQKDDSVLIDAFCFAYSYFSLLGYQIQKRKTDIEETSRFELFGCSLSFLHWIGTSSDFYLQL